MKILKLTKSNKQKCLVIVRITRQNHKIKSHMKHLEDNERTKRSKEELEELLNKLEDAFYLAIIAIKNYRRRYGMKERRNDV